MYQDFFGLKELPFSIAPDPRYLYMSERHREALAHLLYGVSGQGGFVVLTGEVGTGKTTICRCFLNQIPKNTDVAFIINPKLSARELMASICDELGIAYPDSASIKVLNDLINSYLLDAHANNRHTVLIIDEAQNLRVDVLEQLRLLTNLETSEKKLLQIILLGQPELREVLAQNDLRQLAQRITARYHLCELSKVEVGAYVNCRLSVAGRRGRLFNQKAIKTLFNLSGGVPRLINLICDRALLGAYAMQEDVIDAKHIKSAYAEIQGPKFKQPLKLSSSIKRRIIAVLLTIIASIGVFALDKRYDNRIAELESIISSSKTEPELHPASVKQITPEERNDSKAISESGTSAEEVADLQQFSTTEKSPAKAPYADNSSIQIPIINDLSSLKTQKDDRYHAYRMILERWGIDYPLAPFMLACDYAEMYGLKCLHKNGNWRSLLKLDRPAVLTLVNDYGESLYIAILGVEGSDALVSHKNEKYWVSLDEVDRYWFGEYSIVWKVPPYKSNLVMPGQKKEEAWLRKSLSRLSQYKANKSEPIEDQIKRFQASSGLVPDGIAGSMTLIHINSRLNLGVPRLMGAN